ncbi:MAG: error-prone DNA polymerase [Candidatus Lernaella stagnicola]|nr:error-prone DNA polymerase [Candidatus Lernaella stagnicola]
MSYAALWCKSNYSFLEGASHPEELVEEALRLGLKALAITDRDGVYGIVRAHVRARELGMRIIIGAQVSLEDGTMIVLLAENRAGYANLCRLLTKGRLRHAKGESSVTWREVAAHAEGLLALWGGEPSLLTGEEDPTAVAVLLREAFADRLYALHARHLLAAGKQREALLKSRAERFGMPLVAAPEVLYHITSRRPLQDVLTCIRHGVTLHTVGDLTRPNAEFALRSPYMFNKLYEDDPDAVRRTEQIADRCTFSLDEIRYRYPSERLPSGLTSTQWLRQVTFEGARERYGSATPKNVVRQLDKELQVIDELDYGGYFLTMWELVRFCREHGILCQGRGSAANSAVCFCLGITAIDPVRMNLLFERFISKERAEPPDIDLDIMHERREEVIQHMYERYGRDHAAMVANVIRYRGRSAVRDVGKALGLPETSLDRLAKLQHHFGGVDPETFAQAGFDMNVVDHQHLLQLTDEIQNFPRHLSIHPGGFLLGHQPVPTLVPIENATMEGRTVIQWDKEDIEDLGLFKVDLLGLGALTHVDKCLKMLHRHRGVSLSLATIPPDDPHTFAMLQRADTLGVFQIESRAQMSMLPRLRPRNFYDIVIQISIIRPGPITGGMVHPYLRRRRGEEPVDYPHESLRPVLEKTLGIPLFQEQVMKLAVVAADYTPGEADQLRRDMAAWRRSGRINRHRERLISRMIAKGIAREFAERVFEQIQGFGEYGFPESHAASFAIISYATAWLKCHYPAEFYGSLLNAQPMGFYMPATIIDAAKRAGVEMRPVDILQSRWDCTLEPAAPREGKQRFAVRIGLRYVKGLGAGHWEKIDTARRAKPFASVKDFAQRTGLNEKHVGDLAQAGAFVAFGEDRRQALWDGLDVARTPPTPLPTLSAESPQRFARLSELEVVDWDYRLTGHSTRRHPLALVRDSLTHLKLPTARELNARPHDTPARFAGFIICRQRPSTAKGTTFLTMEDETGFVNVIVWPKVFERYSLLLKTRTFLGVAGRLQSEEGVVHLVAQAVFVPHLRVDEPGVRSRDFH